MESCHSCAAMRPIALLWVDPHLVIVGKPSGLAVHRGWADDSEVAMTAARDAIGAHVSPVPRLDRGTSGALVFARTAEMAARLQASFEDGTVEKLYLALVRGPLLAARL